MLFLVLFSGVYLALSHNTSAFTQSLDHTRALYFTISVFSTVGFGDITPRTDTARLIVSAQMLLDLVVIGAVRSPHLQRRQEPDGVHGRPQPTSRHATQGS